MSGLGDTTVATKYHLAIAQVLQYFEYSHLPEPLQAVSKEFADLARHVANRAPDSPETTVALRKLLESKDAAVRAALPPRSQP